MRRREFGGDLRHEALMAGISLCAIWAQTASAQTGGVQTPTPAPAGESAGPSAALTPSTTTPAQEAASSQATSGAANAAQLETIVVTAQRRSERLQDVPLTVTALGGATLEKDGITSPRDLQNAVSGITFSGLGTVSEPSIRGVSTGISAGSNPIALYVDGVYQLNQASLNADLPDVSQLEVLKGPQGTLFGLNAVGGAIVITTKSPSFTPTGDFTLEPGYYTGNDGSRTSGRIDAKGFVAGPLIDGLLAGSLSANYDFTDGYLADDADDGKRTGRIDKVNTRAKLLFTPAPFAKITLSAFYIHDNDQGLLGATAAPGLSAADYFPGSVVPHTPYNVAYDPGNFLATLEQYGTNLRGVFDTPYGTLTSITAYESALTRNLNSVADARGSFACQISFSCVDFDFTNDDHEITQENDFSSRRFGIFSATAGFLYYDSQSKTVGKIGEAFIPGGLTVENNYLHSTSYSVYGEGVAHLTDRLSVIAGVRFNYEPHDDLALPLVGQASTVDLQKNFYSTTPRFSVKYDLTHSLNAYFTYSQGYRAGLTGANNNLSTPPFTPVAPERITAYEGGLKFAAPRLTLDGSVFYYDYKNKQEQIFTGEGDVVENTGPVTIYGFDFDGAVQITPDVRFNAAVTYIPEARYDDFPNASGQSTVFSPMCGGFCPGDRSVVEPTFDATGDRLEKAPEVTANGTLSYTHALAPGNFDASAIASFSSEYTNDLTGVLRQPAYVTLNVQAGLRLRGTSARIGVFARNLTGAVYQVNGLTGAGAFSEGFSQPREVGASLNYSF